MLHPLVELAITKSSTTAYKLLCIVKSYEYRYRAQDIGSSPGRCHCVPSMDHAWSPCMSMKHDGKQLWNHTAAACACHGAHDGAFEAWCMPMTPCSFILRVCVCTHMYTHIPRYWTKRYWTKFSKCNVLVQLRTAVHTLPGHCNTST